MSCFPKKSQTEDASGGQAQDRHQAQMSVRPAGVVFTLFGLAGVVAALAAAAWARFTAVTLPLSFVLSAALISYAWSRQAFRRVDLYRQITPDRVFPGEETSLILKLVNGKQVPLPWAIIRQDLPAGIKLSGNAGQALEEVLALPRRAQVTVEQSLHCPNRGYFPLGALELTSGDPFGLYPRTMTIKNEDAVIVYPRLYELDELGLPARALLGETRVLSRLFEDPTFIRGVRHYTTGDSLRRIHWKVTARTGRLHVREYEPTTTHKVALFVAVDSFAGVPPEDLELALSTTASVARLVIDRGGQVGLFANSQLADGSSSGCLSAAGGQDQLLRILEVLAKVTATASEPLSSFFAARRENLSFGTTPIFVLAHLEATFRTVLVGLRETGLSPVVLQIGEQVAGRVPGVTWHKVSRAFISRRLRQETSLP